MVVDDQQADILVAERRAGFVLAHRRAFVDEAVLRRGFAGEEAEGELGSPADFRSDGGFAAHQFGEVARDGEAKARAAVLARG
ncbi:hypothetical protein D3C83_65370 [compost metagenome]